MTMIKFNLRSFEPIDEGERILKITKAECKPSGRPQKAEVTFTEVSTGKTLQNRYDFGNQYGLMAFGFLCRTALSIPDMGEFDTNDINKLVDKVIKCEIVHTEGTTPREDGSFPVFANIKKVISLVKEEDVTVAKSARASISTMDDLD